MKYLFLLLSLVSLAGCLTTPEREPIVVTKIVEVPVLVKCEISYPNEPPLGVAGLAVEAKSYEKARTALEELEAQRWYAKELRAALGKCAKDIAK